MFLFSGAVEYQRLKLSRLQVCFCLISIFFQQLMNSQWACIVFDLNRFCNWFFKPCQNFPPRASHSCHFISQVRWFLIYYRSTSNGVLRGTQEGISTKSSISQSGFSLRVTAVRFASLSTSHRSNNSETKRADIANSRIDKW